MKGEGRVVVVVALEEGVHGDGQDGGRGAERESVQHRGVERAGR